MFNNIKCILLGDSGVGKSSFIERYTTGQFSESCERVCEIHVELIKIEVATTVTYSIWDSEAQPPNCKRSWSSRESLMSRLIFRDVSVVLICFDVTNRGSFFNCVLWIDQVKRNCPNVPYIIVGMKTDMRGPFRPRPKTRDRKMSAKSRDVHMSSSDASPLDVSMVACTDPTVRYASCQPGVDATNVTCSEADPGELPVRIEAQVNSGDSKERIRNAVLSTEAELKSITSVYATGGLSGLGSCPGPALGHDASAALEAVPLPMAVLSDSELIAEGKIALPEIAELSTSVKLVEVLDIKAGNVELDGDKACPDIAGCDSEVVDSEAAEILQIADASTERIRYEGWKEFQTAGNLANGTKANENGNISLGVNTPVREPAGEVPLRNQAERELRRSNSAGRRRASVRHSFINAEPEGNNPVVDPPGKLARGKSILDGNVSSAEGRSFASDAKAELYLECSAMCDEGVKEIILESIRVAELYRKKKSSVCVIH